jgi:hypothetical protein
VVRGLYTGFRLMTGLRATELPNYVAALTKAGYLLRSEEKAFCGLLHSSLWEACPPLCTEESRRTAITEGAEKTLFQVARSQAHRRHAGSKVGNNLEAAEKHPTCASHISVARIAGPHYDCRPGTAPAEFAERRLL